jgi:tetratricopeptide (TPR) repeat protein
MAECLLKLGQEDAAQKRMVQASDLRKQHGLLPNALLAGRVQSGSGQATIERRITAAASEAEEDPAYWSERAQYYRGRQEPDREEEALKRALSLTRPQPPPNRRDKGYTDSRSRVLSDYVQFLSQQKREHEAVRLLRQELADAPALAESSARAAYLLAFHFDKQLQADDPVLWNWLGTRPVWGHPEERLLWRMLENAAIEAHPVPTPTRPPAQAWRTPEKIAQDLEQHFRRAEKLVANGHFSRAFTLGWIMNRLQFPKRSIPLLQRAVATATDDEARQRANFALLESLLDTGAWQKAEAIFDQAARQLTGREIPQWHSRLALAAAREGHKADALRLWFRTANASPMALRGLEELARLGLREDLLAFYRAMQKEMPASQAPVRALGLLEAR